MSEELALEQRIDALERKVGSIDRITATLISSYARESCFDEPKEPLIKDERTRKVIRAWAEVNSVEEVLYAERTDKSLFVLTDMGGDDTSIMFVGWVPTLKDGADYTIAELCGEEAPEPLEPSFVDLDKRIKEKAASEKLYKGENDMHLTEEDE